MHRDDRQSGSNEGFNRQNLIGSIANAFDKASENTRDLPNDGFRSFREGDNHHRFEDEYASGDANRINTSPSAHGITADRHRFQPHSNSLSNEEHTRMGYQVMLFT